jgi:hypothetical protein
MAAFGVVISFSKSSLTMREFCPVKELPALSEINDPVQFDAGA